MATKRYSECQDCDGQKVEDRVRARAATDFGVEPSAVKLRWVCGYPAHAPGKRHVELEATINE